MLQHVQMKRENFKLPQHARRKILWQKKYTNLFNAAMGVYNGAQVCQIVGLLDSKFDKK